MLGFPCGWIGKESACNVGDLGSVSELGRSLGERKGYSLQYSGLENSMDSPWGHKELDTTERLSLSLWKKLILTLMDNWGVQDLVEDIIADVVGTARELELVVESKDVTELLWSHDITLMDEKLLLMDEQRKWFLAMVPAPSEDCWNDNKVFRILHQLIWYNGDSVWEVNSNFERSSPVDKMLCNSITCYRETIWERKSQCSKLHCCLTLRNCCIHLNLQHSYPDQSECSHV